MRKASAVFISTLLIGFLIVSLTVETGGSTSNNKAYVIKSIVRFTAPTRDGWNLTDDDKAISLYLNTSWQTVTLINSSYSFERVKTDEDGNNIAYPNMPYIRANETEEFAVSYNVTLRPRSIPNIAENEAGVISDIPRNLTAIYLNNSDTWMINNNALGEQAHALASHETKVLAVVENFVNWIWNSITYTAHDLPLYPNETLSLKKGDCDDQAILLVSFCRIVGIPAYLQIGCIYMPSQDNTDHPSLAWNGTIKATEVHVGWHSWAMIYVPPWGWLPVDLTYSSKNSPVAAIETAAVATQDIVQYMNIVQTKYVLEARKYQIFLISNGFHIQTYDEISPAHNANAVGYDFEFLIGIMGEALLVTGIIICFVILLSYVENRKIKNS